MDDGVVELLFRKGVERGNGTDQHFEPFILDEGLEGDSQLSTPLIPHVQDRVCYTVVG